MVGLVSLIAGAVVFIGLPPFLPIYIQSLATKMLIFAILAMSLDLLMGYSGLISLGHAAYFGVGGYTVGVFLLHYGIDSLWITAPAGIFMALLVAAVFGIIALRVTEIYFLLVTVALGQLLFSVAWKWKWISTPGIEGISGITRPTIGLSEFSWNSLSFYYFVFVIFVIAFFLLWRLVNSPFGYALRGIRESEPRMRVLGYNTWLYRYISFVIGGGFAGLAGVLFSYHNGLMVPEHFALVTSGLVMFMVILGGTGTLYGPAIGAIVLIAVEFFAGIITPQRWPLILGSAFVIVIMYARQGIGVYLFKLLKMVIKQHGSVKD